MAGMKGCGICKVVAVLAGLGALNWGMVGILQFDLVAYLFGPMTGITRGIYALIGVAGVVTLISLFKCCPCSTECKSD